MASLPTISPSKITTFLACPHKYYWSYVDSRGKWLLKEKSYYSFGTTLHGVLQKFYDSNETGVTTIGDALRLYEESWIDAGYSSPEEMAEAQGEGREMLIRETHRAAERSSIAKTIAVEKLFRHDMGSFTLIGRVDRLDEHLADGTIEIIDYKSGRQTVTREQVENDIAMTCYQIMVRAQYPHSKVIASIVALRAQTEPFSASAQLTDEELAIAQQDIKEIATQMLSINWEEHHPRRKPICVECDFLRLCQKDPEFA